jgi:DNA polymerase III, delta subunit
VIIGHEAVVARMLADREQSVVLLAGPASVGKFTLARQAAHGLGIRPVDLVCLDHLTAAGARDVGALARTAPLGEVRGFILRLDGATAQATNILLKVLEEPEAGVRFLLVASGPVLPTVVSRCGAVYQFGLLTDDQVRKVLVRNGMDPAEAAKQAPLGGGQVRPAMEPPAQRSLGMVVSALRAVVSGDAAMLCTALGGWDGEAHELLTRVVAEAATGRWRVFTPDQVPGLTPALARKILGASGRFSLANPKLAADAILRPLLGGGARA